jgi:type I site-specific restriction endonuclease
MPRNEAQTRFELIDPALEDRGWNRRTDIRVEETARPIDIVNHQPRERAAGRTDYVLQMWTPSFGQENAEIKLGSQALRD